MTAHIYYNGQTPKLQSFLQNSHREYNDLLLATLSFAAAQIVKPQDRTKYPRRQQIMQVNSQMLIG